jgi:nitrite reductase/ring-hydroxylating ferredoxin subunit
LDLKDGEVVTLEELEGLTRRQVSKNAAVGLVALAIPSCVGFPKDIIARGEPGEPGGTSVGSGGSGGSGAGGTGGTGEGGSSGSGSGGSGGTDDGGRSGQGSSGGSGPADAAGGNDRPTTAMDASPDSGGAVARPTDGGAQDVARAPDATASRADTAGRAGEVDAAAVRPPPAPPPPPPPAPPPPPPPPAAPECSSSAVNTMRAAAAFGNGTATFFSADRTFVCRDSGGLYALTAVCTHAGCTIGFSGAGSGFSCPCHGSRFDFVGNVTGGPAASPLRHFQLCVGPDGNLTFDPRAVVDRGVRFNP